MGRVGRGDQISALATPTRAREGVTRKQHFAERLNLVEQDRSNAPLIRNLPFARARGKNNAALPLECRKMDLHPVITGFLLAIIFAAFLIVGFVS